MTARHLLRLLLPIVLVATAPGASAYNRKAMAAHDDGVTALAEGRWEVARDEFRRALQLDDEEGRTRVSGVKYADYYPSLGLARALLELEDLDGAEKALATFDGIAKPGSEQVAEARALRARLEAERAPAEPAGPSREALAARAALDRGDLAEARRLAAQAPGDPESREVLSAVDDLLARRLTAARRAQEAGALGSARTELQAVLAADPGNAAARSLLETVEADASSARGLLDDARAALKAGSFDQAEQLARDARGRDASLAEDTRELEERISSARRSAATSGRPTPSREPAGGTHDRGRKLLEAARASLDSGRLAEARRQAGDAAAGDASLAGEVEAVRQEVSQRAGQADEALRSARAAVSGGRFQEARNLAERAGRLDRGLASEARELRGRADEDEAQASLRLAKIEAFLESGATAAAQAELQDLAASWPEHPELAGLRATVEGSGELVAGLRAFFSGDWQTSIERLTPLASEQSSGEVLAVLAAAHATRGLVRGGRSGEGTEDLDEAQRLFRKALEASPELELDARYFSPRVRELFRGVQPS